MKKHLLVSHDEDSINAIITSTVELEERVKKALEDHYGDEVEIISVTENSKHPSLFTVVANGKERLNRSTFYLEEVWEY